MDDGGDNNSLPLEELVTRFPHIGERILEELPNASLANCAQVSRTLHRFVTTQAVYTRRQFFKYLQEESGKDHVHGLTALHLGADKGDLTLCEMIIKNVENKNPAGKDSAKGTTPLHCAAIHGHVKVCEFILRHVEEKNPKMTCGTTPLHYAASTGKSEVWALIAGSLPPEERNPPNLAGMTPLHYAAGEGHLDLCKLILETVEDSDPKTRFGGWTPKKLAELKGHSAVAELFASSSSSSRK